MKNINENCKKYFYILFTLLFFTSVFTLTGISKEEAAATETSTATYSSTTPQISYSVTGNKTVGSTITIAVNVTNGANIYGGSLDLLFDSNMLEITSAKMGSLFQKDLKAPLITDTKTPGKTSVVLTLSGANKKLSVTNGSLVIINAKVKKEGTLNLKTTNNSSNLNLNRCTSCIKLSTMYGQPITYNYNDLNISLTQTSSLSAGTYEEDNPNISYVGNWINNSNSKNSGGKGKYSYTSGNYATFSFTGTGFSLYSLASINRGIAKITIDNISYDVDTSSTSLMYKKDIFTKNNLTYGTHTVKIQVTPNKNSSSNANTIFIDYIEIYGTNSLTAGTYEEDNPNISYVGNWINNSDSKNSDGKGKYSYTSGNYATFSFTGTGFSLYSLASINRGIAKITIDNISYDVDTSSTSLMYKKNIFTKNNLTYGTHTVKIQVTPNKNSSSNANTIFIDYIKVI